MLKQSLTKTAKGLLLSTLLLFIQTQYAYAHFKQTRKITFENKSEVIGFNRAGGEGLGGAAWLDFDADGDLDVYITNGFGFENGLFKNNGDGSFENVSQEAGVSNGLGNSGVVVGDIDNDGYPDIFLSGEGRVVGLNQSPIKLYHNLGDGTFEDITLLSGIQDGGSALSVAMGDINNDGFIDLFITSPGHIPFNTGPGTGESNPNKLYLNNGDLTFSDISSSAGIGGMYLHGPTNRMISDGACVVGFSDYNRDGFQDILVGNCNAYPLDNTSTAPVRPTPFNLFENNGDSTFTDVATAAGLNIPGFWMGLALGDFNNDGHIDFFANSSGTLNGFPHVLMRNNGDGTYSDVASDNLANTPFGWGASFADFDNDGDLDLFKVGSLPAFGAIGAEGSPGRFYLNHGSDGFIADMDATDVDLSFDYTSGLAQADYNGDGFIDIIALRSAWQFGDLGNPNGQPLLLQNEGNRNKWITVRLSGTNSNRMGIGARIEVYTRGFYGFKRQVREVRAGGSFASSESPWPTFGLGRWARRCFIKVIWPSGLVEWFPWIRPKQTVNIVEGTGKWQYHR